MLQLTNQTTMSSREIAELTGKQHKDVLYDVRKMLIELELSTADFTAMYKAENGQEYELFNLPKRECLILVSGYSIALRAKIIDRWQELENQQAPKLPSTYLEALENLVIVEKERARFKKLVGIYRIYCINTNKSYIGQSKDILKRWIKHKSELKNSRHNNLYLQRGYLKHGEKNFIYEIIEICKECELDDKEIFYIKKYESHIPSKGYNLESGGNLNKKISTITKIKISESLKGIKKSEDAKNNMRIAQKKRANIISIQMMGHRYNIGIKRSQEFKDNLSIILKGNTRGFKKGSVPHNVKKVNQYTKSLEFIKCFNTISDAAREIGGNGANITACCKGKIKSAYGYRWSYI